MALRNQITPLCIGVVVGVLITCMSQRVNIASTWKLHNNRQVTIDRPVSFNVDMTDSHHHHSSNYQQAQEEYNNTRVLCWVMIRSKDLKTQSKPIKETWGKRCNILLFMSSKTDESIPAIGLKVPEGRENIWLKTKAAWKYILKHYQYRADWFLKVHDDTYVVFENLRHFVSYYDSEKPHYFGRKFKGIKPYGTYNYGKAGYVFSRETLRRFGDIINDKELCPETSLEEEDVEVGRCLSHVGVFAGHTLDARGRERFHPLTPEDHLIPGHTSEDFVSWQQNYKAYKDGPECCSDYSITFHHITPNMMYQLEYFVYHLRAFGQKRIRPS